MKDEIFKLLQHNGFTITDQSYAEKILNKQVGEVIVNGNRRPRYQDVRMKITFIDDGWIGIDEQHSRPTTQWNINVNGNDAGDFIFESVEDFKETLNM